MEYRLFLVGRLLIMPFVKVTGVGVYMSRMFQVDRPLIMPFVKVTRVGAGSRVQLMHWSATQEHSRNNLRWGSERAGTSPLQHGVLNHDGTGRSQVSGDLLAVVHRTLGLHAENRIKAWAETINACIINRATVKANLRCLGEGNLSNEVSTLSVSSQKEIWVRVIFKVSLYSYGEINWSKGNIWCQFTLFQGEKLE